MGLRRRTRRVSFDMARYKEICGRLEYADLDLVGSFGRRPLRPEVLRCIRYMHDVDQHTTCYLRKATLVLRAWKPQF